jgi:hypothetical protein
MSNTGNVHGGIQATWTLEEEMEAYDRLPPLLRKTVREATFKWPARNILHAWQVQGRSASALAAQIVSHERQLTNGR